MARVKKSRKVGRIGVPKESWAPRKPKDPTNTKPKKHKGNPSGSRHSAVELNQQAPNQSKQNDPRIGSKKPIQLIVEPKEFKSKPKPSKPKYFSPAQELAELEDNERLNNLLDNMDSGIALNADDKRYVERKLARHRELCELLGIDVEPEAKDKQVEGKEDDPFARFESINIDEFK
ncbi:MULTISPECIES: Der GTPase-activating protein YihI [Alteromonadaceae]|uniref:Der GTPase-activating protein YihI n=1 Tax=Alteromonadaceae TaxID=72275 RepID=UPI001C094910|nr:MULTISPECIES: Der GTPase-activating protein YihI [Aliiglaciecola]MBU2876485.1 GTPase-activating protein [Aliiglaciecola lipolytica]MDO6713051.1 Der GTPase-activating protein YihI [Aliiglaciecola sp. 2_MG-2023]MDO6754090.1 Der GTPase-activating protein YihI [Aliiglaciecola sp. 1_MG-2023]